MNFPIKKQIFYEALNSNHQKTKNTKKLIFNWNKRNQPNLQNILLKRFHLIRKEGEKEYNRLLLMTDL
jgi:hypothetical protein